MRHLKQCVRDLSGAYCHHHRNNPLLLEAIGIVGIAAFSSLYLVRLTGKLPPRWDDLNFRVVAVILCLILALRRQWPSATQRWYLPYSYFAVFYCLAFFLPLTLLENGGAANTVVNMVIGAMLIALLTDWRNTLAMLLAGYIASVAFYWLTHPHPQLPFEFLYWWIPLSACLAAGGSISKYVEKRAELQRLRHVYSGLAGSIAHEMRAPLAQVQQALNTVEALVPVASEAAVAIGQGQRAVRRGLQAISLTLQQLNTQSLDTERFEELSAEECVRKALKDYAYEDARQREKVSIQVDQDFVFRGDDTAFTLVLFNLLKNALYYLPIKPQATVVIRVTRSPEPCVVVRDTGPGVAPELIARLFEEFQTAGKVEGTGLGLAFCRRAMRTMGGEIGCRSHFGEYTEFKLVFPSATAGRIGTQAAHPPTQAMSLDTATLPLTGQRVLVVDDSPLNLAIARARLASLGCEVTEATHAGDALRMLGEGAVQADAILMDMNMPGLSGLDATRALRALDGPAARIPVLLVTADPTVSARLKAFAAGIDAFLEKPLEPELLLTELARVLAPRAAAAVEPQSDERIAALG
jgi:signal transduction histidine kinase/CheY-like chemotaxis protein